MLVIYLDFHIGNSGHDDYMVVVQLEKITTAQVHNSRIPPRSYKLEEEAHQISSWLFGGGRLGWPSFVILVFGN